MSVRLSLICFLLNFVTADASKRQLTSSGHIAGLHSGKEFGKEERILKKRRDEEVKELAALQGRACIYIK